MKQHTPTFLVETKKKKLRTSANLLFINDLIPNNLYKSIIQYLE